MLHFCDTRRFLWLTCGHFTTQPDPHKASQLQLCTSALPAFDLHLLTVPVCLQTNLPLQLGSSGWTALVGRTSRHMRVE